MKKFLTIAAALMTLSLGACASESRPTAMAAHVTPSLLAPSGSSLRHNLAIADVTGGKHTNPMWASQVSGAAFEAALRQALEETGYYPEGKPGGYIVHADLKSLDQPVVGLTLNVNTTVEYVVQDRNSRGEKYLRTIVETDRDLRRFSDGSRAPAPVERALYPERDTDLHQGPAQAKVSSPKTKKARQ